MTFREWIKRSHAHDTPYGDFIADARRDPRMPDDFASLEDLRSYVRRSPGARRAAVEQAIKAWRRFKAATGERREKTREVNK
jgi:hypothetical protein